MDENLNNKGNAGKGTYMVFGIAIGTVGTAIILIFAVIIRTIMGGSVLNNNNVIQVNSEDVEQKVGVILEVIDKYYYNDDDYRSVLAENIYQSKSKGERWVLRRVNKPLRFPQKMRGQPLR